MRIDIDQTEYDHDGDFLHHGEPFTGEIVETGPDGQIIELFTVKEGVSHGQAQGWYLDGKLRHQGESRDGKPIGVHRNWHHNGRLASENIFDQKSDVISQQQWDENGIPINFRVEDHIYQDENTTLHMYGGEIFSGEAVEALADGRVISITTIRNGLVDGPYRTWYASGRIQSEGYNHQGKPVGVHQQWYENGQRSQETIYNEYNRVIATQKWDEDGNLLE